MRRLHTLRRQLAVAVAPLLFIGCGGGEVARSARRDEALATLVSAEHLLRGGEPARAREELNKARGRCESARDERCAAIARVGLGEHLAATGNPDEARGECEAARAILAGAADTLGEGLALSCIAVAALGEANYADAKTAATEALDRGRRAGNRRLTQWATARLGASLDRMGDTTGGARVFEEAGHDPGGDPVATMEIALQAAATRAGIGERREARGAFEALATEYHRLGDKYGEAAARSSLGRALSDLGDKQGAVASYEAALPLRRAVGDRMGEGTTLSNLGLVYSDRGLKRKALALFIEALPLRRAAHDRAGEAATLNNMGIIHAGLGELDSARDEYERALAGFHAAGDKAGESSALVNLGTLEAMRGDRRGAIDDFAKAVPILRAIGDRPDEVTALGNMALVYSDLGEKQKALELYAEVLPIVRDIGDRNGEARALNNLGLLYAELGDPGHAVERYVEALPILRAVQDRAGEARTDNNIGILLAQLGESKRALAMYRDAATAFRAASDRAGEASALANIGLLQMATGAPRVALASYEQALAMMRAVSDRAGEARVLHNIGVAWEALGDRAKALEALERALPIRRAVSDRGGEAATLDAMARLLATTAPARAILHAKQSVNLFQSLRADLRGLDRDLQRGYAKTVSGAYRRLADLLAGAGRLDEAQAALGLLKDQEFFEFARRDAAAVTGEPMPLRSAEDAASKRYDELARPITALGAQWALLQRNTKRAPDEEARFLELGKQLEQANAAFVSYLEGLDAELGKGAANGAAPVDDVTSGIENALGEMEPGTVAVFTLAGERSLRTILVTSEVRTGYSSPTPLPAAELGKRVLALRQALQDPSVDPRPAARAIYDAVVRPMEKDLRGAGAKTILWHLDGPLRYVPMAALFDGHKWLVESYRGVSLGGESLATMQARPRAKWNALALGVTEAHDGFIALPGVAGEVSALVGDGKASHGLLPGTALLDGAFTESALMDAVRGQPAVIHVASHFAFKPGDEAKSFLLLGDGSHLTLGALRLKPRIFAGVDLLALSACETAVEGGEGTEVDGLARIAEKKGAAAVLATLWPVSDASTPMVMRRFYEVRESRGISKAEALAAAQVEMATGKLGPGGAADGERSARPLQPKAGGRALPGWTHPYFWAPFILLGNGR